MSGDRNPAAEAAAQYLVWALEEITRAGSEEAAHHARLAIKALQIGHSTRATSARNQKTLSDPIS